MDIVTHALMGAILAGPVLPLAPVTGACIVLGSVLPDLDALSRLFGKRAFLRCHQTYTHGLQWPPGRRLAFRLGGPSVMLHVRRELSRTQLDPGRPQGEGGSGGYDGHARERVGKDLRWGWRSADAGTAGSHR